MTYATRFFRDFVRPAKVYRAADDIERAALAQPWPICSRSLPAEATPEDIQTALYDIARPIPRYQNFGAKGATPERPGVSNDWFAMLYGVLLGEAKGPRFGSFVALYGLDATRTLIDDALSGALVARHDAFLAGRAAATG